MHQTHHPCTFFSATPDRRPVHTVTQSQSLFFLLPPCHKNRTRELDHSQIPGKSCKEPPLFSPWYTARNAVRTPARTCGGKVPKAEDFSPLDIHIARATW